MHAYYINTYIHTHHDATLATQLIDRVCKAIGHLSSNNCTELRNTETRQWKIAMNLV